MGVGKEMMEEGEEMGKEMGLEVEEGREKEVLVVV